MRKKIEDRFNYSHRDSWYKIIILGRNCLDMHEVVVTAILSFEEPFTFKQLIEKLRSDSKLDLSKKDTYSCVLSKIQDIFELSSIKVVPFSNPTEYFVEGNI